MVDIYQRELFLLQNYGSRTGPTAAITNIIFDSVLFVFVALYAVVFLK